MMLRLRTSLCALSFLAAVGCGGETAPIEMFEPPPPGLRAQPRWLTFTCVRPGCDTTLVAGIRVEGGRDVAVKRIILDDADREDFEFTSTRSPPFILSASESFEIEVRYQPTGDPRLGDVNLLVTYTDASANESENRIEPGELPIPLVRRLIGEGDLAISPSRLNFGPVKPGDEKTLPLTLKNQGFGNVGVVIEEIESSEPEFTVENLPGNAILPDEDHQLMVTYKPLDERFVEAVLTVRTAEEARAPYEIPMLGTSIDEASLIARPEDGIDFGEVPIMTVSTAPLNILNIGTDPLVVSELEMLDAVDVSLSLPRSATTATVASLDTTTVTVTLDAMIAGPVAGTIRIHSNDGDSPITDVPVTGLVTEPDVQVTPSSVDFGAVPRGWSVPTSVEISNVGFGDLLIQNVSFVIGSSDLFTFQTLPQVPATLRNGERIGFDVEFRSEAEANFNATLSIDTNDPDTPFLEIPLTATGASCDAGCPIANGTPSCSAGVCAIGSCNPGYYDADLEPATGCECAEVGSDPGEFCMDAVDKGTLDDNGDRAQHTGIVPTTDDVDLIRFYGNDGFQFGSDDYDVRVTLQSNDPGIKFCVYRHKTGQNSSECFFEDESCPGNLSYRDDGSSGPDDSAQYIVKVFRDSSPEPSCQPYTVFLRND